MNCPECMSLRVKPRLLDDGRLPEEYECVRCGHVYNPARCPKPLAEAIVADAIDEVLLNTPVPEGKLVNPP